MSQVIETVARSAFAPLLVALIIGFGGAGLALWAGQALTDHRIAKVELAAGNHAELLGSLTSRAAVEAWRLEHIGRRLDAIDSRIEQLTVAIRRANSIDL